MKTIPFLFLLLAISLPAQEVPTAFTGARILTMAGPDIASGTLVVHRGKILAVGPDGAVTIPEGAVNRPMNGQTIMPGLVCTHSHVGGPSGGDRSGPLQSECRAIDSIDPLDPGFVKARAGGITSANIMSGSGHLSSGQTIYVKYRPAKTIEQMAMRGEGGAILGGLKMANGTNPQRDPPFPGTRSKAAAIVRGAFFAAKEYGKRIEAAGGDESKMPSKNLQLDVLLEVLQGKRVVHHHTHRHDDIQTVLRLSKEFGFKVVLHHVSDAWAVAPQIAEHGAPCSIIILDSPGGKIEAKDIAWENGVILERAGVLTAFHTDDPITDSRLFLRSAALAVRAGMSQRKALEGLTIAGAAMLDLQDRIGSLEAGKDADFIILNGAPLSIDTRVQQTWIDGEKVFDLSDPKDRLYAEGGFGASDGQAFATECCFGPGENR